jgi:hypothetical protein
LRPAGTQRTDQFLTQCKRESHRLSDQHNTGKFMMYIGPDTVLPFASAIAAIMGFILMFWRRFVGMVRGAYSAVRRKFSSTESK